MPLTPSDNPVFSDQLPRLDENSTAHADTWNQVHEPLLNNDVYLRNAIQAVNQDLGGKVQGLDSRLHGVEASSAVSVQSAVDLAWSYGGNVIKFEMFTDGYTLLDMKPLAVTQGVNGDDSVDVSSTASLRAGEFYVLSDTVAKVAALVRIQTILTGSRIRLSANLARDWGATATLRRCSFDVQAARMAVAIPGDIYLSRSINIGTDQAGGAVVIRRTLNSGAARLYYRDGYQPNWKECGWSLRRTGGDVPAGLADYEYIMPMRGDGWIRIDIQGEEMTIAHIVALGQATGLGGYINPDLKPNTPTVYWPGNGAGGIMERPTFNIANYSSPAGNAQAALQIQLSATKGFEVVMHDSGVLPAGLSYTIPAGVLSAGVQFWWRARTQDVAGLWSDWMNVSTFTTANSFAYVVPAMITGPGANAADVPEQPTITLSAFATVGGADTHKSSQVQIRDADGAYLAAVWDSGADTVNKLNMVVPAGKLKAGRSYYLRARQEGTSRGWGEWGAEIKVTTKSQFANVIGIALLATGGGSGTWARIDENGNSKVVDAAYFASHAIYGAIQEVIISRQSMIRIPAFYVKTGLIAAGPNAGKRSWMVSDQPLPGYSLHPAFMKDGVPLAQFWLGKYTATWDTGVVPGSILGQANHAGNNLNYYRIRSQIHNANGVTGFGMWNFYQLQAIQLLILIELGSPNVQSLIYKATKTGGLAPDDPEVLAASWRGLTGLWGNMLQWIDGLRTSGTGVYEVWDFEGRETWQRTTQAFPTGGNFAVTTSSAAGALYDLNTSFLPATSDANGGNATFSDSSSIKASSWAMVGGVYNDGAGIFAWNIDVADSYSTSTNVITSRLAKV